MYCLHPSLTVSLSPRDAATCRPMQLILGTPTHSFFLAAHACKHSTYWFAALHEVCWQGHNFGHLVSTCARLPVAQQLGWKSHGLALGHIRCSMLSRCPESLTIECTLQSKACGPPTAHASNAPSYGLNVSNCSMPAASAFTSPTGQAVPSGLAQCLITPCCVRAASSSRKDPPLGARY